MQQNWLSFRRGFRKLWNPPTYMCAHNKLTNSLTNLVALSQCHAYIHHPQGKLTYREHITEGFDKMFDAFMELFSGANIGKAVVKA